MTYQFSSLAGAPAAGTDRREIERDEVHYRARAFGPSAQPVTLLIVNISPHGLMARCETPFEEGDRLRVMLPVVGVAAAEVRWCLGGRLGVSFDIAIDLASYYELLAQMLKKP
ncbi:PilZ domain-containing protein [Sphingomonas sp. BT-65]|uniref:PilZ domain-containing protein n=1 Tax=Sphingomonas sp. BT-65 TaxID=2989821 RepID=UPI0022354C97|nr:PilZ domain-containing protein [Sphingomonas sp. BT-65]MCW4461369.1 PilZ domain-containing protein [Sphingomonas sp. BT-65]